MARAGDARPYENEENDEKSATKERHDLTREKVILAPVYDVSRLVPPHGSTKYKLSSANLT